jgi:hypothetical protein
MAIARKSGGWTRATGRTASQKFRKVIRYRRFRGNSFWVSTLEVGGEWDSHHCCVLKAKNLRDFVFLTIRPDPLESLGEARIEHVRRAIAPLPASRTGRPPLRLNLRQYCEA